MPICLYSSNQLVKTLCLLWPVRFRTLYVLFYSQLFLELALRPINLGNMTVRKINLYSLYLLALLPAYALRRFILERNADWLMLFFTIFVVIIAWGVGILLGIGLAVAVKRPFAEPYLYLASHLAVILVIIVTLKIHIGLTH